jgi:hypothetical protein
LISARWRLALAAKAALLLFLAALFVAFCFRGGLALLFALPALFCAWTSAMGFADALTGRAITVSGAIALASRRNGNSLKLPDGRFAEFILHNPWSALTPHARYTLTIGRWSRVIVEPPRPEAQ